MNCKNTYQWQCKKLKRKTTDIQKNAYKVPQTDMQNFGSKWVTEQSWALKPQRETSRHLPTIQPRPLVKAKVWLGANSLNKSFVFKLSHLWACAPLCLITQDWLVNSVCFQPQSGRCLEYRRDRHTTRGGQINHIIEGGEGQGLHQYGTTLNQICWTCYLFLLLWQSHQ